MGAEARRCDSLADLGDAMVWAQGTDRTAMPVIETDAYLWTEGGADWYAGVPETNDRDSFRTARKGPKALTARQRQGV
jgi:3D-(3,5/4)-trihydroxycyclohexane-1,2-dione acylhydrolase (decyclizing)